MSKKAIYILITFVGIVAIILTLFWTLFALSSVTVEFSSTLINLTATEDEIIEAANLSYGSCVFFDGKSKYTENIYSAVSENPNLAYVRVVNVETVFPNKYIIHVSEREELYAVASGDEFLICDRDLRVLRVATDFVSEEGNAILLSDLSILNEGVAVGDFLEVEESGILKLYSAFLACNRSYSEICGKFESLQLSEYQDELGATYGKLTLTTFSGRVFEICNLDFALPQKISLMFSFESSIYLGSGDYSVDASGNYLDSKDDFVYVTRTTAGELVLSSADDLEAEKLTTALVAQCLIRVDNLTLSSYVERTTSDIYCALVLKDIS